MDTLLEIIFSLIGLFLYWLLTSKPEGKKKTSPPTPSSNNPEYSRKQSGPSSSTPKRKAPSTQPVVTFGDLLEKIEKELYEEKKKSSEEENSTIKTRIIEDEEKSVLTNLTTDRITSDVEVDLSAYKEKTRSKSHITRLFQNHENIRNAIIINEILNKKYF